MKSLNLSSTLCRCLLVSAMTAAPLGAANVLGTFLCNDIAQVKTSISIDRETTADGNGSIKVEAAQSALVTIADQKNLSAPKDHTLWCTLKVRCAGVKQRAYLEMWCEVAEGRRAFSKGLDQLLIGDSDWREIRLPMMVNGDFTVSRALVNVVIEGPGTVWVDEVKFFQRKGLNAVFQAAGTPGQQTTAQPMGDPAWTETQTWVNTIATADGSEAREKALSSILDALKSTEAARIDAGLSATTVLRWFSFDKSKLREAVRPHLDSADAEIRSSAISALMSTTPEPADVNRILSMMPKASKDDCSALAQALAGISKLDFQGEHGEIMLKLVNIGVAAAESEDFDDRRVLRPLWGAKLSPTLESRIIELTRGMDEPRHDRSSAKAREIGNNALYFALSTQANKSEASVERLLELSRNADVINVACRCLWGLRDGVPLEEQAKIAESVARLMDERFNEYLWQEGIVLLEMYAKAEQTPLLKTLADRETLPDAYRDQLQAMIVKKQNHP